MALHYTLQQLDSPRTYARILFVDSSAFNAIIPSLLQDKLSQHNVPYSNCRWITDFLFDRKQHVKLGKHVSKSQTISPDPHKAVFFLPCSSPCTPMVAPPVTSPSSSWCSCVQVHAHWAHLGWEWVHLQVEDWLSGKLVQLEKAQHSKDSGDSHGLQEGRSPTHLLHHCLVRCCHC